MVFEDDEYEEEQEALCCCEYISDITGERSHLLAICCDCEALDDTFESVITGNRPNKSKQIWPTIKDRMRIPWFDGSGAKRLIFLDEPITTIPFIIVPCFAFLATIGPISTLISFVSLFILLFSLRKKLRGSKFYLAFLIAAAIYAFLVFQLEVAPTIDLTIYFCNMIILVFVLLTILMIRRIHFHTKISTNLSAQVNLFPSYCYCRTCQTFIEGRDHHCVWLGCCIGVKNRYWFISTLSLFSIWLSWTIILFNQSLYNDTQQFVSRAPSSVIEDKEERNNDENVALSMNQDASFFSLVYHDFHSSIRAITMVFGCIILLLVLAILVHQLRMIIKGMSYLEWKYTQKMNNKAPTSGSLQQPLTSNTNDE